MTAVIAATCFAVIAFDNGNDDVVIQTLITRGQFNWGYVHDSHGNVKSLRYFGTNYDDLWALEIVKLRHLEFLEIRGQGTISEFSLDEFKALPKLEALDIRNTSLTDDEVARFRGTMPKCKVLHSHRNFKDFAEIKEFHREIEYEPLP
ncbi:hypothetical protein AB1K70_24640 [Bremerella sp. JC770]|uniref:hypothetical protein n=1 Tax=Bremerella sp. JC770 TaxID=3232137 RepID=UPI0034577177